MKKKLIYTKSCLNRKLFIVPAKIIQHKLQQPINLLRRKSVENKIIFRPFRFYISRFYCDFEHFKYIKVDFKIKNKTKYKIRK